MGVYSLTKSSIKTWVKYSSMMAGSAFLDPASDVLITETLIGSTTASVTFDVSALAAQGYKHLQIRSTMRNTAAVGYNILESYLRFNGDTGTNYSRHGITGDGSVSVTNSQNNTSMQVGYITDVEVNANYFGVYVTEILDAFSATKNKSIQSFSGAQAPAGLLGPGQVVGLMSSTWRNTSAIASVTVYPGYGGNPNGSIAAGSRISLYASKG